MKTKLPDDIKRLKQLIKLARENNLQLLKTGDVEIVLGPVLPDLPDMEQYVNPFNYETPEELEAAKKTKQPDEQTEFEQTMFPVIPDFNEDPLELRKRRN